MLDNSAGIAVVIPCYNEEQRLPTTKIAAFLKENPSYHFVMVDDGSEDNTLEVFKKLRRAVGTPQVEIVPLAANAGKAEATRTGLLHACSDAYCNLRRIEWVGYLDADLATPLSEFKELVRIGANDQTLHAVLGSRLPLSGRRIERDWKRRIASRIFALATFTLFRLNIKDTQCGAKLFRRGPWLSSVCQQPFGDRWLFDVELLVRMRRVFGQEFGNKVFEQPLRQWHDENGSRLKLTDFAMAPYHLIKMAWRQSFLQSTPKQAGLPYSEPEAVAERVQQNEQWREERKAA